MTSPFRPCEILENELGALFVCSEHGEYQRIRTPFLYPDGDNIDVFCKFQGDTVAVSDLGETTRWLRMQTVAARRSPKQQALIEDACQNHGVEFFRGMLVARCRPGDSLAAVVTRLAQAFLRVSDVWFTYRTRSVQSVGDEVADFLGERGVPFDRGERLVGRSGRAWLVDFHVRTPRRSSLVCVLATGNRSAARGVVEHVLAAWYTQPRRGQSLQHIERIDVHDPLDAFGRFEVAGRLPDDGSQAVAVAALDQRVKAEQAPQLGDRRRSRTQDTELADAVPRRPGLLLIRLGRGGPRGVQPLHNMLGEMLGRHFRRTTDD